MDFFSEISLKFFLSLSFTLLCAMLLANIVSFLYYGFRYRCDTNVLLFLSSIRNVILYLIF